MLEQLFAYYYASFCIQLLKSRIHIQDSNPLAPGGPSPCAILATEAGRNRMTLGCQVPSLMNCLVLAHVAEMEWGIRLVIHAVKKLNYTWIQTVLRWLVLRITSSGLSVNPLRSQNEVSKDCLSTPARQATHDNVWPLHYDRERALHWTFDLDVIVHELEIITVYDQIILIAYELGNMVFELFWTEHHDT